MVPSWILKIFMADDMDPSKGNWEMSAFLAEQAEPVI